jgi:hypothetical protein
MYSECIDKDLLTESTFKLKMFSFYLLLVSSEIIVFNLILIIFRVKMYLPSCFFQVLFILNVRQIGLA